jgi:uncharacterized protein (UPF0261 family)
MHARKRSKATVVLLGTLDTKGLEYGVLRDRIREAGCDAAAGSRVEEHELDCAINDPAFAEAMAARLDAMIVAQQNIIADRAQSSKAE